MYAFSTYLGKKYKKRDLKLSLDNEQPYFNDSRSHLKRCNMKTCGPIVSGFCLRLSFYYSTYCNMIYNGLNQSRISRYYMFH